MKYSILNCWTDSNKGDLGIMLSTIDEIRKLDKNAIIRGVSCFSQKDDYFSTTHDILRENVDYMYPAIFGILVAKIGSYHSKNVIFKSVIGFVEAFRIVLALLLPKNIGKYFLYSSELETLKVLKGSDISIAKGGSVFANDGTFRKSYGLIRTCAFYFLLKKNSIPYYILGQSFGPVYGKVSIWAVNKVIRNAEKVYLRENICKTSYSYLKFVDEKTGFSNDTAFLLGVKEIDNNILHDNYNVGITVRTAGTDTDKYVNMMKESIIHLVDKYSSTVHIFRQVSGEYEPDDETAKLILQSLPESYRNNIILHMDNYSPKELKFLYSKMDIFIGTRLHSTIFALGADVPSVIIVYHGTKAQGIFENIGLEDFVVTTIDSRNLINKIDYIVKNYEEIRIKIKRNVNLAKSQSEVAISEIIHSEKLEA